VPWRRDVSKGVGDTAPSYALLTSLDELDALARRVAGEKRAFGFDVETGYEGPDREGGSLRAESNILVSYQFTNSLDWGRMIPLGFDNPPNVDNRKAAAILWQLHQATDDEGRPLGVPHNAFAELRWVARWFLRNLWDHPLFGRQVIAAHGYYPIRSDTILERYVEAESPQLGLKPLTLQWFGIKMTEIEELFEGGLTDTRKKVIRFNVLDQNRPDVIDYACDDAHKGLMHHLQCWPRVRDSFIYKLEMQILPIVCDMADRGLHVDWDYIRAGAREAREFEQLMLGDVVADFNELLTQRGHRKLPMDFNFNSSDQRAKLFHDWLGLPVVHRTKEGRISTDAKNAVPKLARLCPAVAKYAKWKKLHDLRDKYLDIYESKYLWAMDRFAHCTLNQYGTIAGRFSCEDFNYQQLPGDFRAELYDGTTFEFSFRSAIKAPPPGWRPWWELVLEDAGAPPELYPAEEGRELGWYLLGGDYSQIELRVMAAQAGETRLINDYLSGADVHTRTAALMLGIPEDQVSPKQRKEGKTRNFANIYGQGVRALADQLGIDLEEAYAKDAQYRALYPRMKPYREGQIRRARREGHLITKFGRKVAIHEYKDPNPKMQAKGDMTAGNACVQGPATGDYVKIAMVRAVRALRKAGLADKVILVMNIHDALEFYVRKDVPPALVIAVLTPAVIFPVRGWLPMVMDWHMGTSWGTAKDLEVLPDGAVRLKKKGAPAPAPAVASPGGVVAGAADRGAVAAAAPPALAPGGERAGGAELPAGRLPDHPGGSGRTVIVTAADVPGTDEGRRLKELLAVLPGPNSVVLRFPGGELPVPGTSGLGPQHEAEVATILPGAIVCYALDSVDAAELVKGLQL